MIQAKPHRLAEFIFLNYLKRILPRGFNSFQILGPLPEPDPQLPILLLPNHSSWWDGLWIYWMNRCLFQRQFYVMMLREQLQRFWFFRYIGAYSIDPGKPKEVLASIHYSKMLLDNGNGDNPLVCIFPQGEMQPWGHRPLDFQPGVNRMVSGIRGRVNILPLAMRAEFLDARLPDLFFKFGECRVTDAGDFAGATVLAREHTALLTALATAINARETGLHLF